MRVLIDHGGYRLLNIGDLSMLGVLCGRLASDARVERVHVTTYDPERLRASGLGVEPASAKAKEVFTRPSKKMTALLDRLPEGSRRVLDGACRGPRYGAFGSGLARAGALSKRGGVGWRSLSEFMRTVKEADALCVAGGGYINDTFPRAGFSVLELAERFLARGKPVGFFGQGLGPVSRPALLDALGRVMRASTVIGLREGELGPALLDKLGVAPDRVVVTGDDAVVLGAGRERSGDGPGRIGVNLRLASYSGLDASQSAGVLRSVAEAAGALGRRVQPVPISWQPTDHDVETVLAAVKLDEETFEEVREPLSPDGVVGLVSRCDAVVTGSYHAAVFALSMGIPVLSVSSSEYYDSKFLGLRGQFGGAGLELVRPDELADAGAARARIEAALASRADIESPTRQAAADQVASSEALFGRFMDACVG